MGVTQVRVAGHLDPHRSGWLGDLALAHHGDGTTTLTGPIADQAQLHGILARLRDMGADVLALQPVRCPRSAVTRPLHTPRLTLRPATPDDAETTWAWRRLPAAGEWLIRVPASLSEHRARFLDPGRLASTLVIERDGRPIGDLMLRIEDGWAQAEVADAARGMQARLGWILHPGHTGQGYATEAVVASIAHCFAELGIRRVVAECALADTASWRLAERAGLRREAHRVQDALHRNGSWIDTLTYAALVSDWPGPGKSTMA